MQRHNRNSLTLIVLSLLMSMLPQMLPAVTVSYSQPIFASLEDRGATEEPPPEEPDLGFGRSVAISADTAMAGMAAHPIQSRVGVYTRVTFPAGDFFWYRTATLFPSNLDDTGFGHAIDLDENIAVIAADAAIYIFEGGQESGWHEVARLETGSPQMLVQQVEHFGGVVAVSASGEGVPGAVFIFERGRKSGWHRTARIVPAGSTADDAFGASLALDGRTLVVGATGADDSGAAYVYVRHGKRWVARQKLLPSHAFPGGEFGTSVDIQNGAIVVGAPRVDFGEEFLTGGFVYVFLRQGRTWVETQSLDAVDLHAGERALFGTRVAMGAGFVAISAPGGFITGGILVFDWDGRTLTNEREVYSGLDGIGVDLDADGLHVIAGDPDYDPDVIGTFGAAHIIEFFPPP